MVRRAEPIGKNEARKIESSRAFRVSGASDNVYRRLINGARSHRVAELTRGRELIRTPSRQAMSSSGPSVAPFPRRASSCFDSDRAEPLKSLSEKLSIRPAARVARRDEMGAVKLLQSVA